jgi:hypothetical protein
MQKTSIREGANRAYVNFLHGLFFSPEDGGDMLLLNVV